MIPKSISDPGQDAERLIRAKMVRRASFYLSLMEKSPNRSVVLCNAKIYACHGVFHPGVSSSTKQFSCWIRSRPASRRFLDFGTGTGALGIVAALAGWPLVTFVDRSGKAIECAKANVRRNSLGAESRFVVANRIDDLPSTYDVIAFAAPYLWFAPPPALKARYGELVYSMFDDDDESKLGVIRASADHLTRGGQLILQIGSMSRESIIRECAEQAGLLCRGRWSMKDGRERGIILEFVRKV